MGAAAQIELALKEAEAIPAAEMDLAAVLYVAGRLDTAAGTTGIHENRSGGSPLARLGHLENGLGVLG